MHLLVFFVFLFHQIVIPLYISVGCGNILDANRGDGWRIYVSHLDLCECNKIVVFEDKLLVDSLFPLVLFGLPSSEQQ